MSSFRPELHVAQQSRRDKLRIQQNSTPNQHLEDYTHNLEQLPFHSGLNTDLIQLRNFGYGNIAYDPTVISSEMINFATNSQPLLASKDGMVMHQRATTAQSDKLMAAETAAFANLSHQISSNLSTSAKVSGDPQNCSTWKSVGLQQNCDWIADYSSGSAGIDGNQNPTFVGEGLSGSLKANLPASSLYMKPSYYNSQDVQSSLLKPSSEISIQSTQRPFMEMHCHSSSLHQNTLQDVVTCATIGTGGLEMKPVGQPNICETSHGSWADRGNELNLLPANYGDQYPLRINHASDFVNRPGEGCYQWNGELGFPVDKITERDNRKVVNDNPTTQGLSLSLSSVPPCRTHVSEVGERNYFRDLPSSTVVFSDFSESRTLKSDYLCSNSKMPICTNVVGSTRQEMSAFTRQNTGPLGPFTGYATILKSSKFLKPAQQLLDEFCRITGPKPMTTGEVCNKISEEIRVSADIVEATESVVGAKGGDSVASTSTFYSSNEFSGEAGGGRSSIESFRSEYQQKKAKLLHMHEEVCRRYKQYHQQMQMVVSSFESVAGLSAAIPYISVALKTVLRHFRCLKNAISDQVRHIRKALGEDLSSPTTDTSNAKGDASTSKLKFIDHGFQKHKPSGSSLGFFESHHVWRPQRGLPERAVAILRAWLFDHFLHPYPTDTDKHMLATQTGLTRNQVSNWFINARVRVWKPMVEEIHVLETKGLAETNTNPGKTDGKRTSDGASPLNDHQPVNRFSKCAVSDKQVNFSGIGSSACNEDGSRAESWNQEKRSRVDCQNPASMGGSWMGFSPYQRSGLEIGGVGAVSLTLGLRQSADSVQQQQHLQRGQMIHDYVG
ncbi:unnamed protein product [Ilex paraguariensis]|uniref:Homeobox domain-containing protein n=1 Tax=Ilex paraguariensis TaxID=185542 RepID=A0ABC8R595_9AQUA